MGKQRMSEHVAAAVDKSMRELHKDLKISDALHQKYSSAALSEIRESLRQTKERVAVLEACVKSRQAVVLEEGVRPLTTSQEVESVSDHDHDGDLEMVSVQGFRPALC